MKKAILSIKTSAFELIWTLVNITFFSTLFITYAKLQENIIFGAVILTWVIATIRNRKRNIINLKEKGLTLDDLDNIKFVKKWQETRKSGLWSYCLKDGAVICGSVLFMVTSLLIFLVVPNFMQLLIESPAHMFQFIGYTYIAAAIVSVIIFKITWPYRERRFNRLTDPLNHEFPLHQQPD